MKTEPIDPIEVIAAVLDYPSVYMGGPSPHARRTAEQVWKALIKAALVRPIERP